MAKFIKDPNSSAIHYINIDLIHEVYLFEGIIDDQGLGCAELWELQSYVPGIKPGNHIYHVALFHDSHEESLENPTRIWFKTKEEAEELLNKIIGQ
jgi:hypothetical protein